MKSEMNDHRHRNLRPPLLCRAPLVAVTGLDLRESLPVRRFGVYVQFFAPRL
jgi:hypothetical protein